MIRKFDDEPILAGVYYLYDGKELVYIGQSNNIPSRIRAHKTEGAKVFDGYDYTVVSNEKERLELEAFMINQFTPKYNVDIPPIALVPSPFEHSTNSKEIEEAKKLYRELKDFKERIRLRELANYFDVDINRMWWKGYIPREVVGEDSFGRYIEWEWIVLNFGFLNQQIKKYRRSEC